MQDYATVAYNVATGAQLWAASYTAPATATTAVLGGGQPEREDSVRHRALARPAAAHIESATVAYSDATGAQLWAARYGIALRYGDGLRRWPSARREDGVCHRVQLRNPGCYATVAYNAVTGAQLWVSALHRSRGQRQFAAR